MMYAMMALFDSDLRDEVFALMELCQLKNYTHFKELSGSSQHGKKEGTVSWPGSNEIILLIVNEQQRTQLKQLVRDLKKEREPSPGLLVFDWKLEELV